MSIKSKRITAAACAVLVTASCLSPLTAVAASSATEETPGSSATQSGNKYAVTFDSTQVTVTAGTAAVTSGDEVDENTVLTVAVTPKSGMNAVLKVNDAEVTGTSVTVTGATAITVEYTAFSAAVAKCITQNCDSTDNIASSVTDTGRRDTTVNFTSPEALNCYPANASIGRNIEGYWCGFDVIAPSFVNDSNLSSVKMQFWQSSSWTDKNFSSIHDGKTADGNYHITLWGTVNHQYLSLFSETYKQPIKYYWQFDWNGDGAFDDRVVLSIDPDGVKLNPPADSVNHTHNFSVECKWDAYKVEDAAGNYYKSCAVCGAAGTETFADANEVAAAVVEKINAIGEVAYTTESKTKINAARAA